VSVVCRVQVVHYVIQLQTPMLCMCTCGTFIYLIIYLNVLLFITQFIKTVCRCQSCQLPASW